MDFEIEALPAIDIGSGVGVPLQLALDSIDEDPDQPRREFDSRELQELADSIAERGVLQPISVRRHPGHEGRWIVNLGARRLRASRLLGRTEIPAFVHETPDCYDQVVENEQREGLKPLELALFIQRRLACGESQAEIARRLGKSAPYVTYATAMIDPPDWLMDLYRQGRCRGLRELHELRRLAAQFETCLPRLQAQSGPITREGLAELRSTLSGSTEARAVNPAAVPEIDGSIAADATTAPSTARVTAAPPRAGSEQSPAPRALPHERLVLLASHQGAILEVVVDEAPQTDGLVFVMRQAGGERTQVEAGQLQLVRIVARTR